MVARMTGRDAVSANQLAADMGLRQQLLSRWLLEASSLPRMSLKNPRRTWTLDEKIRILAEGAPLSGRALEALLTRAGVRAAEYAQWRLALQEDGRASGATTKQLRALERELARKEKAPPRGARSDRCPDPATRRGQRPQPRSDGRPEWSWSDARRRAMDSYTAVSHVRI
jgi:transposase-like protein